MKNIFFLLILLTINNLDYSKKTNGDILIEWGRNNSVYISNKIKLNYTNENTKNFYVKKKIEVNEILISIPQNLLLNIDSALKLSSSKIKKQFEKYKTQKFKQILNNSSELFYQRIEHSFLAYLMTIANKNKSPKNKLYQFYKYFFDTCETNLDNNPLYFSTEQIRPFLFSLLGNEIIQTREAFEEEYITLQSQITKNKFDLDEYIKYRLFTYNKLVNMTGTSSIVPFFDIIETNPVTFNLKINYEVQNQTLNLYALKEIKRGQKLSLAVVQMTNMGSFITYGKTYEENKNFLESFKISKISALYLREKNMNLMLANPNLIDIMKPKFYEELIPDYMELSKLMKGDGSSVSALKLIIDNMESLKRQYEKVTMSSLMKNFFDLKVVESIASILETEKNFLSKKIRDLKKVLSYVDKGKKTDL